MVGCVVSTDIDEDSRCYVDKGFVFLDRLWDYTNTGYFPRSNPVGTQVDSKTRFGDDNSLGGLALLAAAQATSDPANKQRYIHAATREADFLLQSALWDTTFGGGFWWNTGRGDSSEGKPAQTNALAALFLAQIAAYSLDGDEGRLVRARDLGAALVPTFWSDQLGGYNLEAGVPQVFTSAWTSLGHQALSNRGPDGALPPRIYACRDRTARGCETGQSVGVDSTVDTAAQAWAQHFMTMLDVVSQD